MTTPAATRVVYVVDDDEAVLVGLSRLLRSAGIEARTFASAGEFLATVKDMPSTCILLDITMPRITGLEVQQRLKEKGISLPVIAVSARDDKDTRTMARTLGAKLFLRKPVDDRALLDAIGWVMDAKS